MRFGNDTKLNGIWQLILQKTKIKFKIILMSNQPKVIVISDRDKCGSLKNKTQNVEYLT